MPRTYQPPAGRPAGTCRICGHVRTLRKDGTLRAHGKTGQRTNCRGSGAPPKGAGDQRPVWLLDVDGVLNARKPGWGAAPTSRQVWSKLTCREYTVHFAPALMRRIRDLHRTEAVDIRWSTTWCGDTETIETAFCLPPLPSEFEVPPTRFVGDLKLNAALQVLAAGRRLIWTDDMEVPMESWDLHRELTADGLALLIRPDERVGLQPEHLDAIEAFIAEPAHTNGDIP